MLYSKHIQPPGAGDRLLVLTNLITIKVPQAATDGQYAIFQETVPPLGGPPPHTHPDEEIFFVVSGDFEFMLHELGHTTAVGPGGLVRVPGGALHTFKNVGTTPGQLLVTLVPGNLEAYFRAVGTLLAPTDAQPDFTQVPDFAKLDVSKVFALAEAHHIEFFLPQLVQEPRV
jgi:mannose-6-phosphate isomerase-like protein (cupin superfamily)